MWPIACARSHPNVDCAIDARLAIAVTMRLGMNSLCCCRSAAGSRSAWGGDGVKIGFDMLLWTAHVQPEHWPVLEDLKRTGYDGVEIPIFEGEPAHYAELGRRLRQLGLQFDGHRSFPERRHEPDRRAPEQRAAALKHIEWVIECTAAMGAKMVGGPLHSTLGHFSGRSADRGGAPTRRSPFTRQAGEIGARARRHPRP